jgi:hypothetical protein
MKIILYIFFINFIFCKSDADIASESNILPIYNLINNKPSIYFGSQIHNHDNAIFAINISPTSNLLTGGMISIGKNNKDLNLNYKIMIGYITNYKFFNFLNNIIEVGAQRYRFSNSGSFRWYNLSFIESFKLKHININLAWNKILTKQWERNSILFSTNINLIQNVFLQLGVNSFFSPNNNFSSFILINIKL